MKEINIDNIMIKARYVNYILIVDVKYASNL